MKIYKAEAIILKRRNISEADRILTIFTKEYGKLRVIAKGVRKITSRRAPSLEIFSRVKLLLHQGKSMDIITEVDLLDGYQKIRKNLSFVNACYYACELIDALLAERQEQADVYEALRYRLEHIDSDISESEGFALSLLHMLGFLPPDQTLSHHEIGPYVERVAERHIKTYHFLKNE